MNKVQNKEEQVMCEAAVAFSIIVPIYNTPINYFQKCMDSLMNQSLSEIEIILVDDGSRFDCANMCDEFAKQDNRVKVLHQVNQGVSAARNAGIAMAKGKWITFVDADDWLNLDSLEKLNDYLKQTERGDLIDVLLFDLVRERKDTFERIGFEFENNCIYSMTNVTFREYIYERAMGIPIVVKGYASTIWYSCGKVYRKAFLEGNKISFPIGISKSEDKVFILRCFEKMELFSYYSLPLYHYVENDISICHRYSENAADDRKKVVKILSEIALRMDAEIADMKNDRNYNRIYKAYMRFVFGIISDVLFLQFYHADNPKPRNVRVKEAKEFLDTEPFKGSVCQSAYRELPKAVWLKKFLLQHGMVSLFVMIKDARQMFSRRNWRGNNARISLSAASPRGKG